MLSLNDKIIIRLLELKLNSHNDLCNKIIDIKNKLEEQEIREYHIENDFYNWLTYDIYIRNKISKIKKDYLKLSENQKNEFIIRSIDSVVYKNFTLDFYYDYYDYKNINSGLNNIYIRNKSLTECFNSDWWMTTEKNNIHWNEIHQYISFPFTIKVYHKSFINSRTMNSNILSEDLFTSDNFRDATIKERIKILEFFIPLYYTQYITPLYESGIEQDFNTGYIIVDKNLCIF
jgi:hypothetical protein